MKKILLFSMTCLMALALSAQEYVDLGLPSGTKWKDKNESDLYNYNDALTEFGANLPSFSQFEELKDNCKWEWQNNGYKVTGPNGNTIFLPVSKDLRDCNGDWLDAPNVGSYWSSTHMGVDEAWSFSFTVSGKDLNESQMCYWRSVRLVQSKK